MIPSEINLDNAVFLILSFEGPDLYSKAGGLGVRVTELSGALAESGFETHLLFVGDPSLPGHEVLREGKLHLHRWCQWISKYYPDGVYQGEDYKLSDFNTSVPDFIRDQVVRPAAEQGKLVAILGEEWHTAEAMCRTSDLLHYSGLRNRVIPFWNANNTFSFWRIDWNRLRFTSTITTVSRYMKHLMWDLGLNPLVIPNGISRDALGPVDEAAVARVRSVLGDRLVLFKIGRFDPDKRWNMAVEAVARLKALGMRPVFPIRGGIEAHGNEVLANARKLGLVVRDVGGRGRSVDDCIRALEAGADGDVLNLGFFLPDEFVRVMYRAADAVLANSGHEPFGLVGLEVMGAGGVAFTGSTGEDYAIPFENAMVLDTSDPAEIVGYVAHLRNHPHDVEQIRRGAQATAATFVWDKVLENLISKLEYIARDQGVLTPAEPSRPVEPRKRLRRGSRGSLPPTF